MVMQYDYVCMKYPEEVIPKKQKQMGGCQVLGQEEWQYTAEWVWGFMLDWEKCFGTRYKGGGLPNTVHAAGVTELYTLMLHNWGFD